MNLSLSFVVQLSDSLQTSQGVDNEGYLIPSPALLPAASTKCQTVKIQMENWPMLDAKDNRNIATM